MSAPSVHGPAELRRRREEAAASGQGVELGRVLREWLRLSRRIDSLRGFRVNGQRPQDEQQRAEVAERLESCELALAGVEAKLLTVNALAACESLRDLGLLK